MDLKICFSTRYTNIKQVHKKNVQQGNVNQNHNEISLISRRVTLIKRLVLTRLVDRLEKEGRKIVRIRGGG